jgi:hypothetical protein
MAQNHIGVTDQLTLPQSWALGTVSVAMDEGSYANRQLPATTAISLKVERDSGPRMDHGHTLRSL